MSQLSRNFSRFISARIKYGINMLITTSGFNAGELTIDVALDFTEQQLKNMWIETQMV